MKVSIILALLTLLAGACSRNEQRKERSPNFVFDNAFLLPDNEVSKLEAYLDSIYAKRDLRFVFCSIGNYEVNQNVDSLAGTYFKTLKLDDASVLIFVSESTRSLKILAGKIVHQKVNNEELDQISAVMIQYFKKKEFTNGINASVEAILDQI